MSLTGIGLRIYLPAVSRSLRAAGLVLIISPLACSPPAADRNAHYRILPLGNSITQAETSHASYRYPLWKKLIDAGISFDYVGSMKTHRGKGKPPQPDYKEKRFDSDHEGHFAWTVNDILVGRTFDNGTGKGNLRRWLKLYDVDIALVHLGTNDAFNRRPNKITGGKLKKVFRSCVKIILLSP